MGDLYDQSSRLFEIVFLSFPRTTVLSQRHHFKLAQQAFYIAAALDLVVDRLILCPTVNEWPGVSYRNEEDKS